METLFKDIRYAFRMLAGNPGFTAVAVLALMLGIGAGSAIFTVVNAVLLRPLPFKEPERLTQIWGKFDKEGIPRNWISQPEVLDLKEQCTSFEDLGAYTTGGTNLTGAGDPIRVSSASVSATLFPMLGIPAAQGRTFLAEEDEPGKNKVVLLSDGLWRRRFNSDRAVVGGTIALNGESYTVVGIMPPGFQFPDETDLWVPLAIDRANLLSRGSHFMYLIGRLKTGVTVQQAGGELVGIAAHLQEKNPDFYSAGSGWGLYIVPLHEQLVASVRPALLVLLGAVAFVLLIACANVANLLLARATVREKEIAIRAALGAGRACLIRQLLTESVLLAAVGGAAGLALAYFGVRLFARFGPRDIPRIDEIALDWRVLGFTLAVSVATGLIFGLAPAIHISKPQLHDSLKEGGRGQVSGSHLIRNMLVVAEMSLALVLLISAGLMMKSFGRLLEVKPGYRADHVLTMRLSIPQTRYKEDQQVAAFYERLLDGIKTMPGIVSAGAVSHLPLSGAYASGTTVVEDTSGGERTQSFMGHPYIEADRRSVSPGYFATLGISLIEGRLLEDSDDGKAPAVAVVDESFARRFWPGGSAIGKRFVASFTPPNQIAWGRIVGVVAHVKHYGLDKEGREQIYFPLAQRPGRTMYLAIRTAADPAALAGAVRTQVLSLDRDQPVYEVATMDQLVSKSVAQPRLYLGLLVSFAAVALILAGVGIYGVMSYSVTQRTHEIGVRMALGARVGDVMKLVVGQAAVLTAIGLVIGLAGALAVTRIMSSLLFGVGATDPATFLAVSVLLTLAALTACSLPARRAAKVDPMVALRYE